MIKCYSRAFAICFAGLITGLLYAAAPVVDDSENFAIIDQQADEERPLAHDRTVRHNRSDDSEYDDEAPLAHESTPAHSNSNVSLLNQLQSLQQEVQELRGQLELQNHELKVLREQQLTFYKDLDARLHQAPKIENQPAPKPANTSPVQKSPEAAVPISTKLASRPAVAHNNPADEQIRYLAAYDLIKNKRFEDASISMQSFVNDYPNSGYTANAYYWLGELCMTKKEYSQAIKHFETVLNQFPNSSKSAPSLLKLSYALEASGQKQEAIVRLKQVIKQYPDTTTAQLAETKLKSLGH